MATLKITFFWEEDDPMSYDAMIEHLTFIGAYNIEDEPAPEPDPQKKTARKKKKP
jgi:hypothetical protein